MTILNTFTPELRNLIINGNFDFWQRGTTFVTAADGIYSTDRFKYSKTGTMVHSIQQGSSTPTQTQSGFNSSISLQATVTTAEAALSAGDITYFSYRVEGYDYANLHARAGRLQFWVKSSVTGLNSISFQNSATNRSYVTTYTINSANTWEKKNIDLTFDNAGTWLFDNSKGVVINFIMASGTTFQTSTLNTWQSADVRAATGQTNNVATNGNVFQLSQVALYPTTVSSSTDLPFSRAGRTTEQELSLCQRYFYAAFFATGAANASYVGSGQVFSTSLCRVYHGFPTSMRQQAAFTFSAFGDFVALGASGAALTLTAMSAEEIGPNGCSINGSVAATFGTAGDATMIRRGNANGQIYFDAEL